MDENYSALYELFESFNNFLRKKKQICGYSAITHDHQDFQNQLLMYITSAKVYILDDICLLLMYILYECCC